MRSLARTSLGRIWFIIQCLGGMLYVGYFLSSDLHPQAIVCDTLPDLEHQLSFDSQKSSNISIKQVPCRVAITNSKGWHYETLESIAGQLPLNYINLTAWNCQSIVFDYHIERSRKSKSWAYYFETVIQNKNVSNKNGSIQRIIGNLFVHSEKGGQIMNLTHVTNVTYHAQVEASCYCGAKDKNKNSGHVWMQQEPHRTCIFHQACPSVSNHPRAVWPSPHHDHYYIPSMLPRVQMKNTTIPSSLCVIGGTYRRKWDFLQGYLASDKTAKSSRLQFRIMGDGRFPQALQDYKNVTTQSVIWNYQKYHEAIVRHCGAILTLVVKEMSQRDYFLMQSSQLKLTGALPIIVAYKLPFVIHEELYELYKPHLPSNVPFATHNDTLESFRNAMDEFLDEFDHWRD